MEGYAQKYGKQEPIIASHCTNKFEEQDNHAIAPVDGVHLNSFPYSIINMTQLLCLDFSLNFIF